MMWSETSQCWTLTKRSGRFVFSVASSPMCRIQCACAGLTHPLWASGLPGVPGLQQPPAAAPVGGTVGRGCGAAGPAARTALRSWTGEAGAGSVWTWRCWCTGPWGPPCSRSFPQSDWEHKGVKGYTHLRTEAVFLTTLTYFYFSKVFPAGLSLAVEYFHRRVRVGGAALQKYCITAIHYFLAVTE